jgi:nucleoside-diphosphate-sugar epimerase
MKSIALTGASGVVGTRLQQYFKDARFHIFNADIRDELAVKKFCRDSVGCDPTEAFDVNVRGTLNVLEGLRQLKDCAPWTFFASSSHVYASSPDPIKEDALLDPFTLYGLTKLQGEQWCRAYSREFGLSICVGRLFSFSDSLQPNLYFIPAMIHKIRAAEKGATFEIPGVNGQRDFLTVPQLCQTIELLFARKHQGAINIGTGVGTPLIEIVKRIADLLGRDDLIVKAKNDEATFHVANAGLLQSLGGGLTSQLDQLLIEMVGKTACD